MDVVDQLTAPEDPGPSNTGRRLVRRRRVVVATTLGTVLVSIGAMAGSSYIQSPAQAAADTAPPRPSVITATVTSQVLKNTVVLRGTFTQGRQISITPTTVAATAGNPGGADAVVTRLIAKPGDVVKAAQPLLEFSGRPVFALPGVLPTYRDLTPGESGSDVAQLQDALVGLGHSVSPDTRGRFGAGTKRALAQLYTSMGYPVPITDASTAAAVQSTRQEAEHARTALKEALSQPSSPGVNSSHSSTPVSQPTAAVDPADVTALRKQVDQTEQALEQAESVDGPILPASECVYVPSLPAHVATVPVQVGDPIKGPAITLAQGQIQLVGMLDPIQGALVKAGMPVQVLSEILGRQAVGSVASVGALVAPGDANGSAHAQTTGAPTSTANGGAAYLPLTIAPSTPWSSSWAGQDVRITITAATTRGPVLAVPEAAIFAGANTLTDVTTLAKNGTQHTVNVTVGPSADGLVQVIATGNGHLATGDRVVIGQ